MNIRQKLISGVGFVVVLLIALGTAAAIYFMEEALVKETQMRNAQSVEYVGKMADLYLLERASGVRALAKQPSTADALASLDPSELEKLVNDITGINERVDIITGIAVFNENCISIAPDLLNSQANIGKSYADRDYCKGFKETGQTYVSSVYTSVNTGKQAIGIVFPVKDKNGKMLGFILASMSSGKLADQLRTVQLSDSRVILLDRYGTEFLDTSEPAGTSDDSQEIASAVNRDIAQGNHAGSLQRVMKGSEQYVAQYKKFTYLTVIIAQKRSAVLAPLDQMTAMHIWIGIATCALTLAFVWVMIASLVTGRLGRITDVINNISKGDLHARIDENLKASNDEIGELARAFDRTLASLKLAIMKTGMSAKDIGLSRAIEEKEEAVNKYKTLYDNSSDAIMALAPPDWKFSAGNSATVKMFGTKDEQEFIAMAPWQLSPKNQPDGKPSDKKAREMIMKAMKEGSAFFEWTHKRLNGEDFPATVLLTKTAINGKECLQAIVMDISVQKKTEATLLKSEEKFRLLVENNYDIIYMLTASGTFTFVSPAWTTLLGHPTNQVVGHQFQQFVHPDDIPRCMEFLNSVVKLGQKQGGVEYRVRSKDGTWYWHTSSAVPLKDASGKIIGFYGVARDITERKNMEDALKKDEERYRVIVDQSPIAIEFYDKTGVLQNVNSACLRLFGIKNIEEIKGFNLFADPNISEEYKNELLRGKAVRYQGAFDFEKVKKANLYRTSRSGLIWLDVLITPLKVSSNAIGGYLLHIQDITVQKQVEEKIKYERNFSQTVLSSMHQGIDIVDENLNIVYMNSAFEKIFGKNTIGKKCYAVYKDNKKQCDACPLKKPIKIGETRKLVVPGIKGGRTFEISHTGVLMPDGKKAILEIFRDVTEEAGAKGKK